MPDWLLEVTDLKQYTCCPRIVFYRYCLPKVRPITYAMEEGIRSHEEEETREERRSLRNYGLTSGTRVFHLPLQSEQLGLTGRVDLAIATPSREAPDAEAIVVEYKLSEQKAGAHFILQLAAYALQNFRLESPCDSIQGMKSRSLFWGGGEDVATHSRFPSPATHGRALSSRTPPCASDALPYPLLPKTQTEGAGGASP